MTQPTIKEKIQEIAMINEAEYGHVHIDFIRAFARLICEEMTGEKMLETSGNTKSFDEGYNARVTEEKQKAQEILKDLE